MRGKFWIWVWMIIDDHCEKKHEHTDPPKFAQKFSTGALMKFITYL